MSPTPLYVAAGTSRTFTIKLNTQPKGTVKVLLSNPTEANDQVTLSRRDRSFTSGNWNTPQPVTVRATSMADTDAQDNLLPRARQVTVNLTVDGDPNNRDKGYDNATGTVDINVSAALSPVNITTSSSSLTVQEDSTGQYKVRLDRNPASDMTVYLTSPETDTVTVQPPQLVFVPTGDTPTVERNSVERVANGDSDRRTGRGCSGRGCRIGTPMGERYRYAGCQNGDGERR